MNRRGNRFGNFNGVFFGKLCEEKPFLTDHIYYQICVVKNMFGAHREMCIIVTETVRTAVSVLTVYTKHRF